MTRRSLPAALLCVAVVLATSSAAADGASKEALAESLFQEAKRLLAAGQTSAACEKFKASLDVERASGTLTALAFCHQKEGRTASAWAEYTEVESDAKRAGKADQERYAHAQLVELEGQLHRVSVKIASTPNLRVTMDDVELPAAARATPFPVDPGSHTFVATAPGHSTVEKSVEIGRGPGVTVVELPALAETTAPAASPGIATRVWLGAGVAVLGATSVGLGAYFRFAMAERQQENAVFLQTVAYDEEAAAAKHDDATRSSVIGLTAIGAGVVALGFGAYLVITGLSAPPARAPSPSRAVIGPWFASGGGGLSASGSL